MNSAENVVPVQVVFQGGGAKICVLMAVCEVLKEFQSQNRIVVNRVAGASAGAIAAAMLSSKKPIPQFKTEIRQLGQTHIGAMNVWRVFGLLRVLKGRPYFPKLNLEDFFHDLFCKNNGPRKVSELQPITEIFFTDLYSMTSRPVPADEPLPKALAKSCNFPFAFVGSKSGLTEVDGGLALNLPVDNLKKNISTLGEVIAISFDAGFNTQKDHALIAFTQSLFSAAIESGVERSRELVGRQNVFQTSTEIGTFEFERALSEGLGTHYDLAKERFTGWLNNWLLPYERQKPIYHSRFIRPIISNNPLAPAVIRQIDDDLKSSPCTRGKKGFVFDVALFNKEGKFANRYKTKMAQTLEVIRPMSVLQIDFQIGRGDAFSAAHLLCCASIQGRTLPFVPNVQELPTDGGELRSFRLYYYFESRLEPNVVLAIEHEFEADDSYPKLGSDLEDSILRPLLGDAEEMTLAVAFPSTRIPPQPTVTDIGALSANQRERLGLSGPRAQLVVSQPILYDDVMTQLPLEQPMESYYVVARRAFNIKKGQGFGFAIE
jgi:predicted acylesterase/phospholipase RssA